MTAITIVRLIRVCVLFALISACLLFGLSVSGGRSEIASAQGVVSVSSMEKAAEDHSGKPQQDQAALPVLISPGDMLDISVFGEPELARQVRVASDGTANIPMVGNIHLAGMATQEAGDAIASKFRSRNLLREPQVNVLIKDSATQGVSVFGEVQHPGVYQIPAARAFLEVLSMAGGLTAAADPNATVKHKNGQTETISVPLRGNDPSVDIGGDRQVYPGDLIFIPRAGVVYILGEVNRPGGFVMQDSGHTTALELLSQAGGANKVASLNNSVLLRKTGNGYSNTKIRLGQIAHGKQSDMELQANDVIFVPNSKLKSAARGTQDIATAAGSASIYAVFR